jgi:superfamily II DNA/RNA helicase
VRIVSPHRKHTDLKCIIVVQTTLLPLLLPPERRKRSLYLPYDPPSDICVSAPTGSGKTLAYVLPIVEVCAFRRDPRPWRVKSESRYFLPAQ